MAMAAATVLEDAVATTVAVALDLANGGDGAADGKRRRWRYVTADGADNTAWRQTAAMALLR